MHRRNAIFLIRCFSLPPLQEDGRKPSSLDEEESMMKYDQGFFRVFQKDFLPLLPPPPPSHWEVKKIVDDLPRKNKMGA